MRRRVIYETFDAEMSDEDTSGGEVHWVGWEEYLGMCIPCTYDTMSCAIVLGRAISFRAQGHEWRIVFGQE